MTSAALIDVPAAAAGTRTRIHFQGAFTNPNTPDWHYLPFRVPRGVRAIEVRYDFRPHDTGLGFSTNVVDIGIFDPSGKGLGNADGFRGWSGGARRHFRLSHHWATPGYLAGPITPGRWHVILGPFLITPPGTPWHVTVTLEHGAPVRAGVPARTTRPSPCRAPARAGTAATCTPTASTPTAAGPRPSSSPRRRANGLDFLGTSDHNTNAATRVFGRVVPDDFLVVSGEEVTTRNGHWLATGTTPGTWVDWRYRAADHKLARFTDLTRSRGGVAIAAHPFVPVAGTRWDFGTSWSEVDAVEVWNGPWSFFNQLTLERVAAAARGRRLHAGRGQLRLPPRRPGGRAAADGLPPRHPVERGDRGRGPGRPLLDRRVVRGRPDLRGPRDRHHHQHRRVRATPWSSRPASSWPATST